MHYDVTIAGGGPNGLAAALALGSAALPRPLKVLLLDRRDPRHIANDGRSIAITASVQSMLKVLGAWTTLAETASPMREVIVTDGNGSLDSRPRLLHFADAPKGGPAAAMVTGFELSSALLAACLASPHITLQGGFEVRGMSVQPGHITLEAADGTQFSSRLLVAADGKHSGIRKMAGIGVTGHDYGQTALSFTLDHSLPHDNVAEEHFSGDGVFAVLPLAGQQVSIVWGNTPEHAARLMALDEQAFTDELQQRMGHRLGTVHLAGKRASFPLSLQLASTTVGERLALLGDAAHAIHPLAGLGLNLGFKDAAALADCVAAAVARGEDWGSAATLERYERLRRFDTLTTSLLMDVMNGLFVNANPVLSPLRRAGLRLVDQSPALKNMIMGGAAGLSQDNPRLLQGLFPG